MTFNIDDVETHFSMYYLTALLACLILKSLTTILKENFKDSLSRLIRKREWEIITALEFRSWIFRLFSSTFAMWRFSPLHRQLSLFEAWNGVPCLFWSSGFLIHVSIYCSGTLTDSLSVFSCVSDFSFDRSCVCQLFSIWHLVFVILYTLFRICMAICLTSSIWQFSLNLAFHTMFVARKSSERRTRRKLLRGLQ